MSVANECYDGETIGPASRLRPRPVGGAVVGGSAGRLAKQSDERPTETMLPAEKKASVLAGTWNSIQGSKPGLGQPNDGALPGWYETDLYAGASIELDKRWTVSETCYRYVSPSACVIAREAKRGRLGRKPYFSLSWLGRNLQPERCALIIARRRSRSARLPPLSSRALTSNSPCRALPLLDDTTASEPSMIMGPYAPPSGRKPTSEGATTSRSSCRIRTANPPFFSRPATISVRPSGDRNEASPYLDEERHGSGR